MSDELNLPKAYYGPFCMKILNEFIEHHNLPKDLPMPESSSPNHVAIARIFNVMMHSMGDEKRKKLLEDLKEYMMSIPACFRR